MPSYLNFDSTKSFRDELINKTLKAPNGPQTFSSTSYSIQNTATSENKNQGDVTLNQTYNRSDVLKSAYSINRFGPENDNQFIIIEDVQTIPSLGNLALYPYFPVQDVLGRNLIGALNSANYEFESKLAQFSNRYLTDSPDGPVQSRIRQNLEAATLGRLRILDALNGNTATAINIIRGKESLVEKNYKITVAKTLPGKAIDFVQTIAGVEFPFSEIPGQYLTDPATPVNYRPEAKTTAGALLQDITGVLGSIIGIQRRPKRSSKPSDIMYEHLSAGQKDVLHDNLYYSKYRPDYTTVARSQQSSKLFNFPGAVAQGIKNLVGAEAPKGNAYIGDDRSENAIYAMSDFNDNMVRSPYYLSLLFDPIQTRLFQNEKNISEGGQISGKLTWYSKNSKNKLGAHNLEYSSERSKLEESLSTGVAFREDSILAKTQELLNSMPLDGAQSRTHVGNAIDQTSRIFKEGDTFISRGSAVKFFNKKTGKEDGTEYCRVWTKDRSYMNYSDTMKRTGLIRKFNDSIISTPWNLNIAPISNGKRDFKNSTNIDPIVGKAKKYMFSIENLSWKTSNKPGFTVEDLPMCERGSNGGRVMWFPPYDLKVNEAVSANWDANKFLGRPEPIYTYQNTERSGTISFKVIVDHPSILNLLINEVSDEDAENYISSFFAGCEEVDFYTLVRKYTTLDRNDFELIIAYLEYYKDGKTKDIKDELAFKSIAGEQVFEKGETIGDDVKPGDQFAVFNDVLFFENDFPKPNSSLYSDADYSNLYDQYTKGKSKFLTNLGTQLNAILTVDNADNISDRKTIFGQPNPTSGGYTVNQLIQKKKDEITDGFDKLEASFVKLTNTLNQIKQEIPKNSIDKVDLVITSSTSFVADDTYNIKLSYRRSDSILKYVLKTLSKDGTYVKKDYWKSSIKDLDGDPGETKDGAVIALKDLGYGDDITGEIILTFVNKGEKALANGLPQYDCTKQEIKNKGGLKKYAPVTFFCRSTEVELKATHKATDGDTTQTPDKITYGPGKTDIYIKTTEKNRKPPLDEVKRIIMRTLSECFYFKKLEETDPVVFGSLKDKLKYFHPAFHSMTPEGLNARLTFLQQCLRPGDTIPVKGLGRETNYNLDARNTSFGPPPVCVVRIGDFYHSKIIITNMNISFENSTWDFNPEGIGMQPMIADVTLQVNFIGGQGMKEPVAKLQNALSSNFYANTEVYDYKADATVDKKDFFDIYQKFSMGQIVETPKSATVTSAPNTTIDGKFIGVLNEDKLNYNENVKSLIEKTNSYFDSFSSLYNELQKTCGAEILPLFISPTYRTINQLDVQVTESSATQITLLGKYKTGSDFINLFTRFEEKLLEYVDSSDHNLIFDLDIQTGSSKYERSRKIIDPLIKTYVTEFMDLVRGQKITPLEKSRDLLIEDIDKLNFIISANGKDAALSGDTISAKSLTDFNSTVFYESYGKAIDIIKDKHSMFTDELNATFDFNNISFDDIKYKKILAFIIKEKVDKISMEYANSADKTLFDTNTIKKIEKRLNKFISSNLDETKDKKFKHKKAEVKKELPIYSLTDSTLDSTQEEVLRKIHDSKDFSSETKLNFSKAIK